MANVVGRGDPFHSTTDVGTKFDPDTVSAKSPDASAAPVGFSPVTAGTGFGTTCIVTAFDVKCPGLLNVTDSVPTAVSSVAGTVTTSVFGVHPLAFSLIAFTCTVEAALNPLP